MAFIIRPATTDDAALLAWFIQQMAEYEHLTHENHATPGLLREWLFERRCAETVIAELDGEPVGYALYFVSFSTFEAKAGLYLEDLFILPEYRGCGYGSALFDHLRSIAAERGYARFEWACLNWNAPSIEFYKRKGAKPMNGWTTWRLEL